MRSDHQAGNNLAPSWSTPVVSCTGETVSHEYDFQYSIGGNLAFRIYRCKFTAELFIDFLKRLIKHNARKFLLLLMVIRCIKSKQLKIGFLKNSTRIEMFPQCCINSTRDL